MQQDDVAATGWDRDTIERRGLPVRRISAAEVRELELALSHAGSCGKGMFEMAPADFPVGPACVAMLGEVVDQVRGELGFCVLRGLPVQRWTTDEIRMLFWGLGLHVGVPRPQNRVSSFLTDVTDAGTDYRSSTGRGYTSRAALDFHTDAGDMVALLCIRPALSGGTSALASGVRIFEEIRSQRPELAAALCEPFVFSRQGDEAPGQAPYYAASVFGHADRRFACYVRPTHHILNAQKNFPEVPRLDDRQAEALELLYSTMARTDLCVHMCFEPGDIQVIDNYRVVHARTDYEDPPAPGLKRHLLRLWLDVPGSQALPASMRAAVEDVAASGVRAAVRGRGITPGIMRFEARQARHHGMYLRVYPQDELERAGIDAAPASAG